MKKHVMNVRSIYKKTSAVPIGTYETSWWDTLCCCGRAVTYEQLLERPRFWQLPTLQQALETETTIEGLRAAFRTYVQEDSGKAFTGEEAHRFIQQCIDISNRLDHSEWHEAEEFDITVKGKTKHITIEGLVHGQSDFRTKAYNDSITDQLYESEGCLIEDSLVTAFQKPDEAIPKEHQLPMTKHNTWLAHYQKHHKDDYQKDLYTSPTLTLEWKSKEDLQNNAKKYPSYTYPYGFGAELVTYPDLTVQRSLAGIVFRSAELALGCLTYIKKHPDTDEIPIKVGIAHRHQIGILLKNPPLFGEVLKAGGAIAQETVINSLEDIFESG